MIAKIFSEIRSRLPFRAKFIAGYFIVFPISILVIGSLAFQSMEKPDPRFGVAEAFWAPEDAAELGAGWERILFYWKEIQPEGPEDWNTLHVREEWLDEAASSGREVVGLLKNTAIWASEDGTEAGLPSGLYLPVDDPANYWANFTRKIAQYYAPRNVHSWIIWNEPEITPGTYGFEFAGSVEDYYQLLKVAYQVIKAEDPQATIHLAGVTWWHDQSFLRRLFTVAAADPEAPENDWFFDVISLHIYFRPETVLSIITDVQKLLLEYDLDKSIWLNETNAPPNLDPLWPVDRPAFDVDLEQQAWFIIQATALAMSTGTERVAVYKLVDVALPEGAESFGLIRQNGSRRPAFDAYASTIDYLTNFSQASLKEHPHYYVATFVSPERVTRILWTRTTQEVTLQVPALSVKAKVVNHRGDSTIISEEDGNYLIALSPALCYEECLIGGPPLIVIEELSGEEIDQIDPAVAIAGVYPTALAFSTATRYPTATPTVTISPSPTTTPENTITPTPSASPKPSNTQDTSPAPSENATASSSIAFQVDNEQQDESAVTILGETPQPTAASPKENAAVAEGLGNYSTLILLASALLIYVLLIAAVFRQRSSN